MVRIYVKKGSAPLTMIFLRIIERTADARSTHDGAGEERPEAAELPPA